MWMMALLVAASTQEVRHPNLLLDREEIEQTKVKVREHPWAAQLLERVKSKAEKDGEPLEAAIAYVLTGDAKYSLRRPPAPPFRRAKPDAPLRENRRQGRTGVGTLELVGGDRLGL